MSFDDICFSYKSGALPPFFGCIDFDTNGTRTMTELTQWNATAAAAYVVDWQADWFVS